MRIAFLRLMTPTPTKQTCFLLSLMLVAVGAALSMPTAAAECTVNAGVCEGDCLVNLGYCGRYGACTINAELECDGCYGGMEDCRTASCFVNIADCWYGGHCTVNAGSCVYPTGSCDVNFSSGCAGDCGFQAFGLCYEDGRCMLNVGFSLVQSGCSGDCTLNVGAPAWCEGDCALNAGASAACEGDCIVNVGVLSRCAETCVVRIGAADWLGFGTYYCVLL